MQVYVSISAEGKNINLISLSYFLLNKCEPEAHVD